MTSLHAIFWSGSLQEEEAPAIGWSFLIRGADRHRADTCVFVELDWVSAAMHQAEDRGHRAGQTAKGYHIQSSGAYAGQAESG